MQGAFFVQKNKMKGGGKLHNTNITLAIADQRKHFYQWDTGRKLIVTGLAEGSQIHFHREGMAQPFPLPVYAVGSDLFCNVPDELLQKAKSFAAYTYITDKNGNLTRSRKTFAVEDRPKPADYIYTETENYTLEKAIEEALKDVIDGQLDLSTNPAVLELDAKVDTKQDKLSFDGEYNAESNKAATVETVIRKVAEIVANAPEDFDTLKELSDWLITHGAEAAEMNSAIKQNTDDIAEVKEGLTSYVKNTDYAGEGVAGLVKVSNFYGCLTSNGTLRFYGATEDEVKKRNNGSYTGNRLVKLDYFDLALKHGLISNKHTLTDTEKSSAAKWLGVPNAYEVENPEMVVDIPFPTGSGYFQTLFDERVYLASNNTFDKSELMSTTSPFYAEILDSNGVTHTVNLTECTVSDKTSYIKIDCGYEVGIYVVYDESNSPLDYDTGSVRMSEGIHFTQSDHSGAKVTKLYRSASVIVPIDNKYLDLANNAVIKALMARIAALEAKA